MRSFQTETGLLLLQVYGGDVKLDLPFVIKDAINLYYDFSKESFLSILEVRDERLAILAHQETQISIQKTNQFIFLQCIFIIDLESEVLLLLKVVI